MPHWGIKVAWVMCQSDALVNRATSPLEVAVVLKNQLAFETQLNILMQFTLITQFKVILLPAVFDH